MTSIGIVTTASLPWLTGTSIIPLFHAVYLNRRGYRATLYVPWLPVSQQGHCFADHRLTTEDEQRAYIKDWLSPELRPFCPEIRFYPAIYIKAFESIYPRCDLNRRIDAHDLILLEEPEHLFAPYPWSGIRRSRRHVIGVVMTNYEYYLGQHIPTFLARWYQHYSRFVMQRMCHKLVAIAPVQPDVYSLACCEVSPLNGANANCFRPPSPDRGNGCYFIGKLIAEKGLEEMFRNLQAANAHRSGSECGETQQDCGHIDLYGKGDALWLDQLSAKYGVSHKYHGVSYRPWEDLAPYRIFINCSRSEYLCTTTADALAMQQWVIVPRHPSNEFYMTFRNCLAYSSVDEFVAQYHYARSHQPADDPELQQLSWNAVCDRLTAIIERKLND